MVDRAEQIPVGHADVTGGIEHRGLADLGALLLAGIDFELQPQASGYLHLGGEAQQAIRLEPLDPPEIDRVAYPQVDGVAPPAPQSDAASQRVEQSACPPEP